MLPTLKAVLARFAGNREQAQDYCVQVAVQYPQLRTEYGILASMLLPRK
jgi:hypothetical protein